MARKPWLAVVLAAVAAASSASAAWAGHAYVPDDRFADAGRALTDFGYVSGLAARPGGGVVAARAKHLGAGALTAAGAPDAGFGTAGAAEFDLPRVEEHGAAVAVDDRGRVVVAGSVAPVVPHTHPAPEVHAASSMAAVRYLSDGAVDTSFGSGGIAVMAFDGGAAAARSIAILDGGAIVLGGYAADGRAAALARLQADGRPDEGFSDDGRYWRDLLPGLESVRGLVPELGRLTFAGTTNGGQSFAARLAGDDLDPSYGRRGILELPGGPVDTAALSAAAGANGRLLLAGRFAGVRGVLAVDRGGRIDGTYGSGGIAAVTWAAGARPLNAVQMAPLPGGDAAVVWEEFDPLARRSQLAFERFDAGGRSRGEPGRIAFWSAGLTTAMPTGLAPTADGGATAAAWATGHAEDARGVLARVAPAAPHAAPAAVRRACRRTSAGHRARHRARARTAHRCRRR
ncbi:MAG TPA: hypothetical protein VM266_14320 [Solirubrobacteraceae bacterium]|nr:hypothetical protein [Solirubrobacteraceae bacterium]